MRFLAPELVKTAMDKERPTKRGAARRAAAGFPDRFRTERGVPLWAAFRPEGQRLAYTLQRPWRIAYYLRKYRLCKSTTAPDELAHFNRQRAVFAALRSETAPPDAVRLGVVGDIMWVRTNWARFLDPAVLDYLRGCDAVLGNLETPIDETTPPVEWYHLDARKFNSDPRLLEDFYDQARGRNVFTVVSTANNHTFDRGDAGARRTLALLDRLGIGHTGLREPQAADGGIAVFERCGIRFGVYGAGYGYNNPGYRSGLRYNTVPGLAPWPYRLKAMDLSGIAAALAAMDRAQVDFRILLIHWGHEFELYPTPVQVQLGQRLAAMGFDLIAGSHSHVLQPCEVCYLNGYPPPPGLAVRPLAGRGGPRKALIGYSLGNFSTAMLHWETKIGAILTLHVHRNRVTGGVDWTMPGLAFVYNILAIHNHGRKELHLLSEYVRRNLDLLRRAFPLHRRIMGRLVRHMLEPRPPADLKRRAREEDFNWLLEHL
jgi:poly-gamma-glutamate synthesis protein (capsule biosynthesis protein)